VNYPLSQSEITHIIFTVVDRLDHRTLVFTRLAQRSLTLQPGNLLISPGLTLSVGFNTSITLHAATQARRLLAFTAAGLLSPLSSIRVTLWITTAIHLDTPTKDLTPRLNNARNGATICGGEASALKLEGSFAALQIRCFRSQDLPTIYKKSTLVR
jgi:hypothetical protein